MYNKTIIRFGFCDIQNNQGLGKGYHPQPSAWTDNPYLELDYGLSQKPHPIILSLILTRDYLSIAIKFSWHIVVCDITKILKLQSTVLEKYIDDIKSLRCFCRYVTP